MFEKFSPAVGIPKIFGNSAGFWWLQPPEGDSATATIFDV